MHTFTEINDRTGFSNGEMFTNEAQVHAYFTPDAQRAMFGADAITDDRILNDCADMVLANRWHCAF